MCESISLWETPLCGSSSQSFLSQEVDREEETKAAEGQIRQHQRVLQSQEQAGPGSYLLWTGSPMQPGTHGGKEACPACSPFL